MPKKKPAVPRQQGKAYTDEQKAKIMESIRPYLQLEFDIKNACAMANAPYESVLNWIKKDPALYIQVEAWQKSVQAKSRQNVAQTISQGDVENSKWWLLHSGKKNFSHKIEQTGKDGGPIQVDYLEEAKKRANNWEDEKD